MKIEGDIAQLGERLPCKQEVAGSIPTISTTQLKNSRTQIKAQRSGFDLKRRRSGASFHRKAEARDAELVPTNGPVAQLARAYD